MENNINRILDHNCSSEYQIAKRAGGRARKITEVVYFSIACYLFLSVLLYELQTCGSFILREGRSWKKVLFRQEKVLCHMAMRIGAANATTFILILRLVSIVGIYRVPMSKLSCDFVAKGKPVLWSVATLSVYFVLWAKQRIMCGNPALKHLTNHLTRVTSVTIGAVFLVAHIVHTCLLARSQKGEKTKDGCIVVPTIHRHTQFAMMVSITITLILTQFTLLMLFVHPLIQHIKNVKLSNNTDKYAPLLKKAFCSAFVCVITDAFGPVGILFVTDIQSYKVYYFGISLLVDVVCINLCFKNGFLRLFPFYKIYKRTQLSVKLKTRRINVENQSRIVTEGTISITIKGKRSESKSHIISA